MRIKAKADLDETVARVGRDLQAIQDYVGRDFRQPCKIRFPRGFLRSASHFRERLAFVADQTLRENLGYALMLHDVQHWMLVRTDLGGIAKEMVLKDAIMLLGNVAEALTKVPLVKTWQKEAYKQRTQRLERLGIISAALHTELNWLWSTRCKCHLFQVDSREYGHYTSADYSRAVMTLRNLRDALDAYFAQVSKLAK